MLLAAVAFRIVNFFSWAILLQNSIDGIIECIIEETSAELNLGHGLTEGLLGNYQLMNFQSSYHALHFPECIQGSGSAALSKESQVA